MSCARERDIRMYERMLDKTVVPTIDELTAYCGETSELFALLNDWLSETCETMQTIVFPYGNKYGWCIAHKKKGKLICNIFAECGAFTVMLRLSNAQFDSIYDKVCAYTRQYIDNKYPCGEGGWIHIRVTCAEHLDNIKTLLNVKCDTK